MKKSEPWVWNEYACSPHSRMLEETVAEEIRQHPVSMPILGASAPRVAKEPKAVKKTRSQTVKRRGVNPDVDPDDAPRGTYRVRSLSAMPFLACGKVAVSTAGGSGHGSGCLIAPGVILTAAHVIEGPTTGVAFIPSTVGTDGRGRVASIPVWRSLYSRLYSDARGRKNYAYDVALLLTHPDAPTWEDVYGYCGWDLSAPSVGQQVTSAGYPMDPPTSYQFDGDTLWASAGPAKATDDDGLLALDCAMTRGCSGGPWVRPGLEDGTWGVVSLNSHVRDFADRVMFGPDLSLDLPRMWDAVVAYETAYNAGRNPKDKGYARWTTGQASARPPVDSNGVPL